MTTEQWALVISGLALISSVALPLWFRQGDMEEKIAAKRSLLLQKILSMKSFVCTSRFQIVYLLQRYGDKMEPNQLAALRAQIPRLEEHESELWKFLEECRNYDDGCSLHQLDEILSHVTVSESELADMAKMIENGSKSYETM